MMAALLPAMVFGLSGCVVGAVASTAVGIATLPVRAAGYTADKLTTSQAESDRNYGRKMRKEDERRAKEERKRRKRERDRD